MIDKYHSWNISYKPPVIGFILSLVLLVAAYRFEVHHHLQGSALIFAIFGFAILQALIQFVFFLFLGLESKPRENTIIFLFMVLVIIIIVGGSIWIMSNLNYNMMPQMGH